MTLFARQLLTPPTVHGTGGTPTPKVSVILPTYSRGDNGLLDRAIASVLAQTFTDFELIVMDDGSRDSTAARLAHWVAQDARVIHVRHEQNSGLPALRVNEALLRARGEFCAYQFDDDQWTPQALEVLVQALEQQPEFDVAYGRATLSLPSGEIIELGAPFNYSKLVAGNYIANNSLLHRRSVFTRFGGYDMHVLMRRLCDWDLWLRWSRQVRFLFVDAQVSLVEAAMEHSLGSTVPADVFSARARMALPRDAALTPERLPDYDLCQMHDLRHLGPAKLEALWRQQIGPFWDRHPQWVPDLSPARPRPLHVLVAKADFDTTVDITIHNFAARLAEDFVFTFMPQVQVDQQALSHADMLLLHRTIDYHAQGLLEQARQLGKPVLFLMDDDLLTLHEVSDEFWYLAPGSPCHGVLQNLIREADLCLTYSPGMQQSVLPLTSRQVLLQTSIQEHWLTRAQARIDETSIDPANQTPPSPATEVVHLAFAGGGARQEEFATLWPALVAASARWRERLHVHFWGFTPQGLEQLQSPYDCTGFTFSYNEYLRRLTERGFDLMLAPLFTATAAKRAKCPIKFLEITAAGAVGLYSDVEPYAVVEHGVTGYKCANTVAAWTETLLQALEQSAAQRRTMLKQALQVVRSQFSAEVQAPQLAAALDAACLQQRCRNPERAITYLVSDASALAALRPYAELLQAYDVPVHWLWLGTEPAPDAALPATAVWWPGPSSAGSPLGATDIAHWLQQQNIALVHAVTLPEPWHQALQQAGLALVLSPPPGSTPAADQARPAPAQWLIGPDWPTLNAWAEPWALPARKIPAPHPDRAATHASALFLSYLQAQNLAPHAAHNEWALQKAAVLPPPLPRSWTQQLRQQRWVQGAQMRLFQHWHGLRRRWGSRHR